MLNVVWGAVGFLAGWLLGGQRGQENESVAIPPADGAALPRMQPGELEAFTGQLSAQVHDLRAVAAELQPLLAELSITRDTAEALRTSIGLLDKQLGRVGREQFKLNTLSETQQQQIQAALDQLRELGSRREADLALLREQLQSNQAAQRLVVIQQLLPALDGLDQALTAGRRLLARSPQPAPIAPPPLTFSRRIAIAVGGPLPVIQSEAGPEWREAASAWLTGVEFVRERLLQLLDAEGIQPIPARGQAFNPHEHIAVEAIPAPADVAPGTIVDEYRRGYRMGERVLRPAEVVVAK